MSKRIEGRARALTSKPRRKDPSIAPGAGWSATPFAQTISDRQREVFAQAARLFVEKGYEGTSMSDIAAAVKLTKAGLYHFVNRKEDLLFTIMSWGMQELYEEVVYPAQSVEAPLERLKLILRNHLSNIGRGIGAQGNPVTIVADQPGGLNPERRAVIDELKRGYFDLVRRTLEEMRQRGELADGLDPTVTAHCIIGMIMWTARWPRPEGRLSVDDLIEQITSVAVGGAVSTDEPASQQAAMPPR